MDILKRPVKSIGNYDIHYYREKPVLVKVPAWADPHTPFEPLRRYEGALSLYNRNFSPIRVPTEIAKIFNRKALLSPFSEPKTQYAVEVLADQYIDPNLGIGLHPDTYKELSELSDQKHWDYRSAIITDNKEFVPIKKGKIDFIEILLRPFSERFIKTFDSFFYYLIKNPSRYRNNKE
ncbi:MAG: hypothetical protein ACTSR3_10085 [Candidatus Helarchaeota archaeon]